MSNERDQISSDPQGVTRRRFLAACAAAGIAPSVALAQGPGAPQGVRLVKDSAGVLTKDDFRYLGFFQVPASVKPFNAGVFTARRYSGNEGALTFLMIADGNSNAGNPHVLVEINYPGVGTSLANGLAGAPVASSLRSWPDIINRTGDQLALGGSGVGGAWAVHGIGYIGNVLGNGEQIIIGYNGGYGAYPGDPGILTTVLNDNGTCTTYGPWSNRTLGGQVMCGHSHLVPDTIRAATGCGRIWTQSPTAGFAAAGAWGANFITWDVPALSTPRDVPQVSTNPKAAIVSRQGVFYNISNPQPRTWTNALWEAGSVGFGGGCPDKLWTPGNYFAGGVGYDGKRALTNPDGSPLGAILDWMDCGVLIQTANKRGLLLAGQRVDWVSGYPYKTGDNKNHMWYGSDHCCHAPTGNAWLLNASPGPQAETVVHYCWVFDPNDMIKGLNGTIPVSGPGAAMPINEFTADQFASGGFKTGLSYSVLADPAFPMIRHQQREFSSMYFDSPTNLLFLSQDGFTPAYYYAPVIHVFQLTNP